MATKVPIPKLGQSEETVTIDSWKVKEGDVIKKGDVLFEVETDKAVLEVESQFEGTLLKVVIQAGKEVPVMSTAAVIGAPGEDIPEIEAPAPPKKAEPKKAESKKAPAKLEEPTAAKAATTAPQTIAPEATQITRKPNPSPRAKKYAKNYLINLDNIPGTGGNADRVTEGDVKQYLEDTGYYDKKITPAAFNIAKKENLDLLSIDGTGDHGRITLSDIKGAIVEKPQEFNNMRRIIAQRLTESKQQIPHFYVTVGVDMTDLGEKRKALKAEEINLSVNDFIIKAVSLSLKAYPMLNATTDGIKYNLKSKVNIGVAVSVENGLVVPVVKNSDKKEMDEIHAEVAELACKARENKLGPDDMKGGTFTISNMGMLNVENFSAIINPGESAILAVSSAIPTPVVKDAKLLFGNIMKITVSADHRLVDGAMAAKFVNEVKKKLEDIDFWNTQI